MTHNPEDPMTLLKKNIWLLFTVLLVSGVVLLASLSVTRWRGLVEHYGYNQYALTQHWQFLRHT